MEDSSTRVTLTEDDVEVVRQIEDRSSDTVVLYRLETQALAPSVVHLEEAIPLAEEIEALEFHPNYRPNEWTTGEETIQFDTIVSPDETRTVVLGIDADVEDPVRGGEPTITISDAEATDLDELPESTPGTRESAIGSLNGHRPDLLGSDTVADGGEATDHPDSKELDLDAPNEADVESATEEAPNPDGQELSPEEIGAAIEGDEPAGAAVDQDEDPDSAVVDDAVDAPSDEPAVESAGPSEAADPPNVTEAEGEEAAIDSSETGGDLGAEDAPGIENEPDTEADLGIEDAAETENEPDTEADLGIEDAAETENEPETEADLGAGDAAETENAPDTEADLGAEDDEESSAGLEGSTPATTNDGSQAGSTPDDDANSLVTELLAEIEAGRASESELDALRSELGLTRSDDVRFRHIQSRMDDFEAYADALEGIINTHGTASEFVDGIERQVTDLHDEISAVRNEITTVEEGLETADDDRETLSEDVSELEETVAGVSDEVAELTDLVETVEDRTDTLETELREELESIREERDQELERIETELEDVRERLEDDFGTEVDSLREDVESFNEVRRSLLDAFGGGLDPTTGDDTAER